METETQALETLPTTNVAADTTESAGATQASSNTPKRANNGRKNHNDLPSLDSPSVPASSQNSIHRVVRSSSLKSARRSENATGTTSDVALTSTTATTTTSNGPLSTPHSMHERRDVDPATTTTTTLRRLTNHGGSIVHTPPPALATGTTNKRLYLTGDNKWVTRDIASLDFLLGIPLAAERDIVVTGWQLQRQRQDDDSTSSHSSHRHSSSKPKYAREVPFTAKGTWWEKWVQSEPALLPLNAPTVRGGAAHMESDEAELEQPTQADATAAVQAMNTLPHHATTPLLLGRNTHAQHAFLSYAPGRRLEGDEAVRIHIPVTFDNTITKQRSIARQAALREWELQTAHGLSNNVATVTHPVAAARPTSARPKMVGTTSAPMLDGRLFFSANSSYPISVFSVIRYEPKKEEAAIRRRKLEAIGGGGSQFVLPNRDWRGISYRALLRRSGDDTKEDKKFNRFLQKWNSNHQEGTTSDSSSSSSLSSDDSDDYVPGVLDDPEMVQGRHRTVMIGDRVTGPIVSTTIQFVQPALLKAELNKQFRERFDGWEPPKRARKYIGAKVIQGNYVLMDPTTDEFDEQSYERRQRHGRSSSTNSIGTTAASEDNTAPEKIIRMPPSLTLSKIRSLKNQVLHAAVRANLEIGTVALACVYFERLCLDCRVDKSNRRLAFAACLLLAAKLNEPNLGLVMRHAEGGTESMTSSETDKPRRLQALIRPNKTSNKMFASLLLFFTQDWSLSLTHLFTAEWGVFAALGFSLDATPVQIAFHFKRLMKTLEWSPLDYLGSTMYNHWQHALVDEEERRVKRERRRERKRQANEERLLNLHIEIEHEVLRRQTERHASDDVSFGGDPELPEHPAPRNTAATATSATAPTRVPKSPHKRPGANERRLKLFNRFAQRRSVSTDRLEERSRRKDTELLDHTLETPLPRSGSTGRLLVHSPSMPTLPNVFSVDTGMVAIDILNVRTGGSDTSSIGGVGPDDGIFV